MEIKVTGFFKRLLLGAATVIASATVVSAQSAELDCKPRQFAIGNFGIPTQPSSSANLTSSDVVTFRAEGAYSTSGSDLPNISNIFADYTISKINSSVSDARVGFSNGNSANNDGANPWGAQDWPQIIQNETKRTGSSNGYRMEIELSEPVLGAGFLIGDIDTYPETINSVQFFNPNGDNISFTDTNSLDPLDVNTSFRQLGANLHDTELGVTYSNTTRGNPTTYDSKHYISFQAAMSQEVKKIVIEYGEGGIVFSTVWYSVCLPEISISPASIDHFDREVATVTVQMLDELGHPDASPGVDIALSSNAPSAISIDSVTKATDSKGQANFQVRGKNAGDYLLIGHLGTTASGYKFGSVSLTVTNTAPIAVAGVDQTVSAGDVISLDGSGSTDTNDAELLYAWTQIGGSSSVAVSSGNGPIATFTAPSLTVATTFVFQLTVSDGDNGVGTDTVSVTVLPGSTDQAGPVISGPSGEPGTGTSAVSIFENTAAVTTLSATDENTFTWSIAPSSTGDDNGLFAINSNGSLVFKAEFIPDYENPADVGGQNTYLVRVVATDSFGNVSTQDITVTILDLWDSLPGTVNGDDVDGDGIADSLESNSADRDGDGIVDASDYDPVGYLYCEDDGRILAGGSISVVGPAGSNSSVGTLNNIRIVKDGSGGEYQWFATAAGTYTMSVTYPSSVGVPSTTRLSSGTLDVTGLLPENPASIGSSEYLDEGILANYRSGYGLSTPAANSTTAFYTTFVIAEGDPNVIGNNIPVAQCGDNNVTVARTTNGAEANGATPSQGVFTVSQGRISTADTTVTYAITGTATSGADFTALSGSVTILAGDNSATVPVPILEDALIEGDETIILTLTGINTGDLTTQLGATVEASITITDDDFATVLISNDDLNTTEGRDDPAVMRFSLAGQPTAPVVLTFAGDAQCSVAPSTLTFDGTDFATLQTLRIQALNDEDVEGTHSCQPTVVVSSTDTRFNSLSVTLATVTVGDDLVDQVRDPLTNILQSDFQQTVATQSRQFGQIAKGALDRLRNQEDLPCGEIQARDVDGAADASEGAFNTAGTFNEDVFNCVTGVRKITQGSFAVNSSPSVHTQGIFTMTVQNEKRVEDNALRGFLYGGYLSSASLDGVATGEISGVGGHLGVYGANQLNNGLLADYYAAGSLGRHEFDLSFYAPTAAIEAKGDYSYRALYAGAGLSGELAYDSVMFRPRAGINVAYADASDADVSATQLGITDTGRIELDPVNGTRLFAEAVWVFGEPAPEDEVDGISTETFTRIFEVAPRVYCERGLGRDTRDCGYGGYISFNEHNERTGSDIAVTLDYESKTKSYTSFGLEFSYSRNVLDDAGSLVTRFGTDHRGNANLSQNLSFAF